MGCRSARRTNISLQQGGRGLYISCFVAARDKFIRPASGVPVRKMFAILAAVIAVLGLSWFLLKEKDWKEDAHCQRTSRKTRSTATNRLNVYVQL